MSEGSLKWTRVPEDKTCSNPQCQKTLQTGTFAYYNEETQQAICYSCGAKRGMMPKDRADKLMRAKELVEDIKALTEHRKTLENRCHELEQKINIYRLAEDHSRIQQEADKLIAEQQQFFQAGGTEKEKKALEALTKTIDKATEVMTEIEKRIESNYVLFRKDEKKRKKLLAPDEPVE